MRALHLRHFTAVSGLGLGCAATRAALEAARGALAPCHFETAAIDTCVAEVRAVEAVQLPQPLRSYDCRNNRLAQLVLEQDGLAAQVRARIGALGARRVGIFIGTSTSGILQTELAYRQRDPASGALPAGFHYAHTHNTFSVVDFLRRSLGIEGPAAAIGTACSSSAKVFAAAARMIDAGLIDAALVGGVDSLCLTTLYGFHSLQLTAPGPCRPFDLQREGMSIGEAAALAWLEPAAASLDADAVLLAGTGESSDAYHMSSPHPQGAGALAAMRAALASAGLEAAEIDYVNLHGTGTASNDSAEARAVNALFDHAPPPCSSTKGATGHALGAAGALEAVICALALQSSLMPGGLNTHQPDPALLPGYLMQNRQAPLQRVLSNSFGFGGANCTLLLERAG